MGLLHKTGLAILLLTVLSCSSCKEPELDVLAEIPFRVEFEIPAGINVFEDHFFPFEGLQNTYDNVLAARGVDPSRVQRINPATARLVVLFENKPLAFIRELSVYLSSDQVGRESEAYWTPEIPFNTGDQLNIPGTLIDASDFFAEDLINLEVRLDTREVPSSFLQVRLDMTFNALGE